MLMHQTPLPMVPSPQAFLKVPVWKNVHHTQVMTELLPGPLPHSTPVLETHSRGLVFTVSVTQHRDTEEASLREDWSVGVSTGNCPNTQPSIGDTIP